MPRHLPTLYALIPLLRSLGTTASKLLNLYQWALPLFAFEKSFARFEAANKLQVSGRLASPASRSVVKPNVDTLYSRLCFDLKESNVEIQVPELEDGRYWSVALYDP